MENLTGQNASLGMINRYAGIIEPQGTWSVAKNSDVDVKEILVSEGDSVEEGEVLFIYDTSKYEEDLQQAQIDLERLHNEYDSAEETIAQLKKEKNSASSSEQANYTIQIKEQNLALKDKELDIEMKEAEIEKLESNIENAEVKSGIDGVVKSINENGNSGNSNDNSFITVMKVGTYRVKGTVNEQNIGDLYVDAPVLVYSRVNDDMWKGTIVKIDTENAISSDSGGFVGSGSSDSKSSSYPFYVDIRHNVHEGNKAEVEKLSAFVRELDRESAATLHYYPSVVAGNQASAQRGSRLGLLCSSDAGDIGIRHDANRFHKGRGQVCMAHSLFGVGIDDEGRLYKCWEDVDKPEHSFGHVKTWDPFSPLETAENRDMLTAYLNTASPIPDPECRECVWLPACSGGCPSRRLFDKRDCVAYKDHPEKYALALYERILEKANRP